MKKYLSQSEVMELLSVSCRTLCRWRKSGYLPAIKIGGQVRYNIKEVNSFMCNTLLEK
jgi:excisionase family DNA binding protein